MFIHKHNIFKKNKDELEILEELENLQSKEKQVRLVENLGKQGYHHDIKRLFEPVLNSIKEASEDVTRTMIESSKESIKAITTLNNKLLEIMNDRGVIASYLLSPLSKIINLENTSQLKLVKDSISNRVNDLMIHNTIPVTLYDILLRFRDTKKEFELKGDLFKMITNKFYNVDLASLSGKKLMYDFAKEMHLDVSGPDNKHTRDRSLIKRP